MLMFVSVVSSMSTVYNVDAGMMIVIYIIMHLMGRSINIVGRGSLETDYAEYKYYEKSTMTCQYYVN